MPTGFVASAAEDDARVVATSAYAGAVTTPREVRIGPVIAVLVMVGVLLAIFVF